MRRGRFQLPTAEDDLWEQVVLALLHQRDAEILARDQLRLLEELAFHHRFCGKSLTYPFVLKTATWLAEEMKPGSPGNQARKWLEELEQRWELLIQRGSGNDAIYEFPILGLDEYFAARHLAARWAENDPNYQLWLPCYEGWWDRDDKLLCPNPHCRVTLACFANLVRRAEYEETVLLMTGLLMTPEREKIFLAGILGIVNLDLKASFIDPWIDPTSAGQGTTGPNKSDDPGHDLIRDMDEFENALEPAVNLFLKALSRCRNAHSTASRNAAKMLVRLEDLFLLMCGTGIHAIPTARVRANLDNFFGYFAKLLQPGRSAEALRSKAVFVLALLGDFRAIDPITTILVDSTNNASLRSDAARALGILGDARSFEPLRSTFYLGKDYHLRNSAANALVELNPRRALAVLVAGLASGSDSEVEPLIKPCVDWARRRGDAPQGLLDDPVRWLRGYSQRLLEKTKSRNRPQNS